MFIFPFGPGTCYSSSLQRLVPCEFQQTHSVSFSMAQLIPSRSAYNSEKKLGKLFGATILEGILDSLDKSQYKSGHTDTTGAMQKV